MLYSRAGQFGRMRLRMRSRVRSSGPATLFRGDGHETISMVILLLPLIQVGQ